MNYNAKQQQEIDIQKALKKVFHDKLDELFFYLDDMRNKYIYNIYANSIPNHICMPAEIANMIFNCKKPPRTRSKKDYHNFIDEASYSELISMVKRISPKNFRYLYTDLASKTFYSEAILLEDIYHSNMDKLFETKSKRDILGALYLNFAYGVRLVFSPYIKTEYLEMQVKDILKEEAPKELFVERIFSDTYRNVLKNITSLYAFQENYKDIMTKEHNEQIELLKGFIKDCDDKHLIQHLSDKVSYYLSLKPSLQETLYDAIQTARMATAINIKENCSNLETFRTEVKDGVKYIYADKNPYNFVISNTHYERDENLDQFNLTTSREFDLQSCSLVSHDALYTFSDLAQFVTVGYVNFDPNLLYAVNTKDNYVEYKRSTHFGIKIPNDYMTSQQIIDKAKEGKTYNELNFINFTNPDEVRFKYGEATYNRMPKFTPDFIFCLKEPTKQEVELAKRLDIPLFIANEQKYEKTFMQTMPDHIFDETL